MNPIIDVFDAARDGSYADFLALYDGNPHQENALLGMPLLLLPVCNDTNPDDKLAIIKHLIHDGADVNAVEHKQQLNALGLFYMQVTRSAPEYAMKVSTVFISAGIDVNHQDSLGATPLSYAVSTLKAATDSLVDLYKLLLDAGANPRIADSYGNTPIDYAQQFPWRHDLIDLLESYK